MTWLQSIKCHSAEHLLEILSPNSVEWASDTLEPQWLFRGMGNDVPLLPQAWRKQPITGIDVRAAIASAPNFANEFVRHYQSPHVHPGQLCDAGPNWQRLTEDKKEERARTFVIQSVFELRMLTDFADVADNVGHPIEVPTWRKRHVRIAEYVGFVERIVETLLAATAQHHRIPTRLLDWSYSPFVAAYFAAFNAIDQCVVWALRREAVRRTQRLREFTVPRASLPFLHAQSGCFVWDERPYADFARTGEWPSQEHVIEEYAQQPHALKKTMAFKLLLPTAEAPRLLQLLWQHRISQAHLMPTFDSVAATLLTTFNWRNHNSFFD